MGEEAKKKIGDANKGNIPWNLGIPFSDEICKKMSLSQTGKKLSEETKKKMSDFQKSRIRTENENKINSESKKGEKNPMYGKKPWNKGKTGFKKSEETLEKIRRRYKCKYCGRSMNKSNLTRYHNKNCKLRNHNETAGLENI